MAAGWREWRWHAELALLEHCSDAWRMARVMRSLAEDVPRQAIGLATPDAASTIPFEPIAPAVVLIIEQVSN